MKRRLTDSKRSARKTLLMRLDFIQRCSVIVTNLFNLFAAENLFHSQYS